MPNPASREPSLVEAAVLGVLVHEPSHGFAVARAYEADAPLGAALRIRRTAIYRALDGLYRRGLLQELATQSTDLGPERKVLEATDLGQEVFRDWLGTPITRPRQVRLELVLKLMLHDFLSQDPAPLLRAQLPILQEQYETWRERLPESVAEDSFVALWRANSARSALEYVEQALRRTAPDA